MNSALTFRVVSKALESAGLAHGVLDLGAGARAIVVERGGRILGPFLADDEPSLLWLNDVLLSTERLRSFLGADDWNLGGERVRIGPELQYAVPDRSRFWESYAMSPEDDPGRYSLKVDARGRAWRLDKDMILDVYPAGGTKSLRMERLVRKAADPLRELSVFPDLVREVRYAGYEHRITIREPVADGVVSHAWNLIQVWPGGSVWIPVLPLAQYTDYYDPVQTAVEIRTPTHAGLRITGDRMFKRGYRSAHVLGRVGYLGRYGDGQAYLLVRNFYNNPSYRYLDEPFAKPGWRGDSVQVYQDDGALGGFAEIECIGEDVDATVGKSEVTDSMMLWCYAGPIASVGEIAAHLIGWNPIESL